MNTLFLTLLVTLACSSLPTQAQGPVGPPRRKTKSQGSQTQEDPDRQKDEDRVKSMPSPDVPQTPKIQGSQTNPKNQDSSSQTSSDQIPDVNQNTLPKPALQPPQGSPGQGDGQDYPEYQWPGNWPQYYQPGYPSGGGNTQGDNNQGNPAYQWPPGTWVNQSGYPNQGYYPAWPYYPGYNNYPGTNYPGTNYPGSSYPGGYYPGTDYYYPGYYYPWTNGGNAGGYPNTGGPSSPGGQDNRFQGGGGVGNQGYRPHRPQDPSLFYYPGNLTCYECRLDFRQGPYRGDHPCLGRHNNLNVSVNFLQQCNISDTYCRTERTEENSILIIMRRQCTTKCRPGCKIQRRQPFKVEVCNTCCRTQACNHVYPPSLPDTAPIASTPSLLLLVLYWGVRAIL